MNQNKMHIFSSKDFIIYMLSCLFLTSCLDKTFETGWGDQPYEIAIPLINSEISVSRLISASEGTTALVVAPDGRVSVVYNNENVLSKNVTAIFPPFPGLFPYELKDSVSSVQLPVSAGQLVKKAIFKNTKIGFFFESNTASDIKVNLRIPELTKNNVVFEKEFTIKNTGTLPLRLQTELISVDGWTYNSNNNLITFRYNAVTTNGTKLVLDKALMNFDVLNFAYIEGYLGYHKFPIEGSVIKIGLFDQWKSGGFDFTDPKLSISVDNSFGVPVKSKINKLDLKLINGSVISLQSPFIASGIDFNYPPLSEAGGLKTTHFEFNKSNSNIRDIFNEKTSEIIYDLNAIVNPLQDTTINGHVTGDSYFTVKVAVEVPLSGSVNQVVIADTVDVNLTEFDKIQSAEFKTIIANDFPADVRVQAIFIDEKNIALDQLFNGSGLFIPAAIIAANGITIPGQEKTEFITMDETRFEKIKKSKKMVITGTINTTGSDTKRPLWIYDKYSIKVKAGVKLKLKL
ncbi:MAG: hypothetical protein WAT46_19390 [Saprospiraceae bacterium]